VSAPPAASEAATARKARRDGAGVLGPSDMINLLDFNELSARSDEHERFRNERFPYLMRADAKCAGNFGRRFRMMLSSIDTFGEIFSRWLCDNLRLSADRVVYATAG
jgi:hypothetical protein